MSTLYNEIDPFAVDLLQELQNDDQIALGRIDRRSITELRAEDLAGIRRVHLFAGLGGWDYALRLAGWPRDRPVWTGSCPCPPFSVAGKSKPCPACGGKSPLPCPVQTAVFICRDCFHEWRADERHLWPEMWRLIDGARPPVVFGEQVAGPDGLLWLAGVRATLGRIGYRFGAACLPACSVQAPHLRYRLFWVAHDPGQRWRQSGSNGVAGRRGADEPDGLCADGSLADANCSKRGPEWTANPGREGRGPEASGRRGEGAGPVVDAAKVRRAGTDGTREQEQGPVQGCQGSGPVGDSGGEGLEVRVLPEGPQQIRPGAAAQSGGHWGDTMWWPCRDPKRGIVWRRVPTEPIFQFESDGISRIMGDMWNRLIAQLREKVILHASKANCGPGSLLRAMWGPAVQEAIQGGAGMQEEVPGSEILLIALCELARHSQHEFLISAQDLRGIQEGLLRVVWKTGATACSSQERKLEGPQAGESSDPLHLVPPAWGAQEGTQEVHGVRGKIPEARDVSEALLSMEEVWRSTSEQGEGRRNAERFRSGARAIRAMSLFPVSGKVPGRVGTLRCSGNSIVPQVAAKFVEAFLRTES